MTSAGGKLCTGSDERQRRNSFGLSRVQMTTLALGRSSTVGVGLEFLSGSNWGSAALTVAPPEQMPNWQPAAPQDDHAGIAVFRSNLDV